MVTDEELMLNYARNDALEAFDELYRRYSSKVFGYLMKRCHDKKIAEEIYQEVFMKIHASRLNYQEQFPFSAWLFTIVRNSLIDSIRKQKTQNKIQNEFLGEEYAEDQEPEYEDWKKLVNDLSTEQKELLELRYLKDWSFDQIAKELNLNSSAVRKRLSRLIKTLRGTL